jgi:hypothetical protein
MDEQQRRARELDALEAIAMELERLRVLNEHELGVRLEYPPEGDPLTWSRSRIRKGLSGPGHPSGRPGLVVANLPRRKGRSEEVRHIPHDGNRERGDRGVDNVAIGAVPTAV